MRFSTSVDGQISFCIVKQQVMWTPCIVLVPCILVVLRSFYVNVTIFEIFSKNYFKALFNEN